jgi:hypothetical protein
LIKHPKGIAHPSLGFPTPGPSDDQYFLLGGLPNRFLLPGRQLDLQLPIDVGDGVFRGHRYLHIRKRVTWTEASALCRDLGGHQVTITSREENEFIGQLVAGDSLSSWRPLPGSLRQQHDRIEAPSRPGRSPRRGVDLGSPTGIDDEDRHLERQLDQVPAGAAADVAPEGRLYSWWDYRMLAFPQNDGLRLNYLFAAAPLACRSTSAQIDRQERKGEKPSDHAPLVAVFQG